MSHGTKLAVGILLVWFGGVCLFIAFMSGKVPSLNTGTTDGKAQGPKDVTGLLTGVANAVQQQEQKGTGTP